MEKIMRIKDELIDMVNEQIAHGGMRAIETREMGEVVDMIKDLAEACYYCEKAKETEMCLQYKQEDGYGYGSWDRNQKQERMYYPMHMPVNYNQGGNSSNGGSSTGGSYGGRRGYNDGGISSKEVERYINELSDELIDMLKDIPPEDKAMFQQKIASLANKIK